MDLDTPLQFTKGIGPARAEMLAAKNLHTVNDLLFYPPFRYEDRTNAKSIALLAPGEKAAVTAWVTRARASGFGFRRGAGPGLGLFEAEFEDGSGPALLARWFHGERFRDSLLPGTRVALFGKVELDAAATRAASASAATTTTGTTLMVQPEIEILSSEDAPEETLHSGRIVAVYEAAGRVSTRVFRSLLDRILKSVDLPPDPLPKALRERLGLPTLADALRSLHSPPPDAGLELLNTFRTPAQTRLIFDEFFWLECGLALKRAHARRTPGISFTLDSHVRDRLKLLLPFKPTAAQRRVTQEIADDMKSPRPMNRLLQGDVGSGKTIVAAQAAVIAIENGYQTALLAPTEILAAQHASYLARVTAPLGYRVAALTGSQSAREKNALKNAVAANQIQIVVGTHALLEENVAFSNLGLAIVDEQHRFGVRQRLSLFRKSAHPDVLVMTATPIPRTLALTLYGDLDVSSIDELPPGRRPIRTTHAPHSRIDEVYRKVRTEIAAGRQAYIVYPLVEETETRADTKAAENMFTQLSTTVFPEFTVGLLHGRLAPDAKEAAMRAFQTGQTRILVATSVIEVGVDVPNASVMVIENAERFGLAQLHQLRGRVGRGSHQSFCILVTGKLNEVAQQRIRTLTDSSDGFKIAEMDMCLRGPGEFFGTRQSGLPGLRLANLLRDGDILELARGEVQTLIASGPPEDLRAANRYVQDHWQRRYGLVRVG